MLACVPGLSQIICLSWETREVRYPCLLRTKSPNLLPCILASGCSRDLDRMVAPQIRSARQEVHPWVTFSDKWPLPPALPPLRSGHPSLHRWGYSSSTQSPCPTKAPEIRNHPLLAAGWALGGSGSKANCLRQDC